MKYHPNLVKGVISILQGVFVDGSHADKLISSQFKNNKKWGSQDRHFIAETVYEMIRWWRLLSTIDEEAWIPATDGAWARRWLAYEKWKHGRSVDWTWVIAKLGLADRDLNFTMIEQNVLKIKQLKIGERLSYPDWVVEKFAQQFPKDYEAVLNALNGTAPVCLRANTLKTTRDELLNIFRSGEAKLQPHENVSTALVLDERMNVFSTPMFRDGLFEVQDVASQRVAALLDPKPNEKVADVCAGAGGKTLHISALMQNTGMLFACDPLKYKLFELKRRASRAGCSNIRTEVLSTTKFAKRHNKFFDKVLLDVPCSGTGVFRRNPDSKWKLTNEELERLKETQKEILSSYSKMVKPGGKMVYSTCSLLNEENGEQVKDFLKTNTEFQLISEDTRRPDLHQEDGFYMALLQRKGAPERAPTIN
jgi:16S rRNA (cytosine967-C5)-methyltransferase